jgi:hypothetical protein
VEFPSIWMIFLFEPLPKKGNEGRSIAQRNPSHLMFRPRTSHQWLGGSQVPSVRSFDVPGGISPEFLGGALEVW